MITLFGKTVYKVLTIFKDGKRLVSPVYSFEYELGKIYSSKLGFYSCKDIETARLLARKITGNFKIGIYRCRIPWFSKYEVIGNGNILSKKIKIKERV